MIRVLSGLRPLLLLGTLLALGLVGPGCAVDPYCIGCLGEDAFVEDAGVVVEDDAAMRPDGDAAVTRIDGCVPMPESCNGADDDCNGLVDDGITGIGGVCGTDEGECTTGRFVCTDGVLSCGGGAINPMAESCNGLDDDCDGMIDDSDPGGGVPCGEATGDCQAGVTACRAGAIVCEGAIGPSPEVCDGRDNDCDGTLDDGNPEGGAVCLMGMDACTTGTQRCRGGALMCIVDSTPGRESCDRVDNDCDGTIDEDFDLMTDRLHCGDCSTACMPASGRGICMAGTCRLAGCDSGHFDLDGDLTNGCEYACDVRGAEVCNGVDDDCNGMVDDALTPPDVCFLAGECAGTVATCGRAMGWVCAYSPTVSLGPLGDVTPEASCDGLDNDCDGVVDDSYTMLGSACTRGVGACQRVGVLVCNATADGTSCTAPSAGMPTAETCNSIDDDCDGTVDEDVTDDWVTITGAFGSREIYRYEASRPDATFDTPGSSARRSCSAPNRLPWTNVTRPQAEAACMAAGARLCTEAEWQRACETSGTPACTWGYGTACDSYQSLDCNGNDFDADLSRPFDQDRLYATGAFPNCFASWGATDRIFDISGNVAEWTAPRSPGVSAQRGGSYSTPRQGLSCGFNFVVANDTFLFNNVGFRCCR